MNPNKTVVEAYFATDRSFAGGKALYGKLINPRRSFINALNRMAETPANTSKLQYELGQAAGFSERLVKILCNKPLKKGGVQELGPGAPVAEAIEKALVNKQIQDEFTLPEFPTGLPGLKEKKAFAEKHKILVVGTGKSGRYKSTDLDFAFKRWQRQGRYQQKLAIVTKAPGPVKQALKLREQFPFLNKKDCPDVYHTLTGKMISAYNQFVEAHPKLHEDLTEEEVQAAVADVVVPFKENKQIWAELEHYQKNGKPLGLHPIFEDIEYKKSLTNMSGDELSTEKGNLKSNISRAKTAIKDAKNDKEVEKASDKKEKLESKLATVTAELSKR